MEKYLLSLNDLPQDGKTLSLDDQEIWKAPIKEFKMECRITSPLKCDITVLPAENGCLARGTLKGEIVLPCNRCAEDANVIIESSFDEFEEIPEDARAASKNGDGESHVVFEHNVPMLNLADVAWEQFMLALPSNPLCRPDCKGLCMKCGANLNIGPCQCGNDDDEDNPMAALRHLQLKKH